MGKYGKKASEYVEQAMHEYKEGTSPAKHPQQAIAIGLSQARRAGVKVPLPPKKTKKTK